MPSPSRVTVIGSYIVALVMDMDRLPIEGETVVGRNFHSTFGGKGSNAAVAAARLGADSWFLGKLGHDSFAADFVAMLEREGVHREAVLYSKNLPTGVGIILFNSIGTNLIAIDPGANSQLSPTDLVEHRDVIRSSSAVISPLEIHLDTALAGARLASEHGVKSILNPAPACDLRNSDLSAVFALTPNETEARVCLGLPSDDPANDHQLARALLDLGPQNVILTRGAQGVLWASRDGVRSVPALRVNPVDTVGAGDAFNAGFAVGLGEGQPILQSIALGVAAASLSTEKRETLASYPHRHEVEPRLPELLRHLR
ncbi:MAG TPA: ribokinase [Candidatus Eisenbacteria bacterium]|nr:ribokinase [Candidatus Eisenbacteria bacterium]